MASYVSFHTSIVPMRWGQNEYSVLPLKFEVMEALRFPKRVEGTINDHAVNLAVVNAPFSVIDTPFLWIGKSLLDDISAVPGDNVLIRLRPADPGVVDIPADLTEALRGAGRTAEWEALTPGRKRGLLVLVNSAKRAETRADRIAKLLVKLD